MNRLEKLTERYNDPEDYLSADEMWELCTLALERIKELEEEIKKGQNNG